MSTLAPPRPALGAAPPSTPPPRGTGPPWRGPEATSARADDLATLCSFLVTLTVALSLGRLFQGTSWLAYGAAAAVLGHGMAWGLRRLGCGLLLTSLASPLCTMVVAVELVLPRATTFGLPTPSTLKIMGQALTDAQSSFRHAVPPVVPAPGFLVAAVVGVCMTAFLADWAAFRMRTAFEACVPTLGLFVFAAVLGARSHRAISVAAFAATTLGFLIVQRANLDRREVAWFGGRDRGGLPSLLSTGAVLGAVAVIGALVLGPRVPGATAKPLVSFKNGPSGSGSRSTVSPLVDIQARLRDFANVDVFDVQADAPAYWRLTSLDQFDGTIWSSNERYAGTKGQLEASTTAATILEQRVSVTGLSSIWLPAAFRPAKVQGVEGLSYSPGSDSVISKKDTSNGLRYTMTSKIPNPRVDALRTAPSSSPAASGLGRDLSRYLEVPGSIRTRVQQKARQLGASQPTAYGKARQLQDYFRSGEFTYNLKVPAGHSANAVENFLFVTKTGYCEQFAGSYALLARLMGLPARVAVGFQPGTESGGTFSVKDSDAHAWPEVYLEGTGWTAFEPTPGRANPQAQEYTGIPYTPAEPTTPDPAPSATPTTLPGTDAGPTTTVAPEPAAPEIAPLNHGNPLAGLLALLRRALPLLAALVVVGGAAGGSAAWVSWERRRRRQAAGSPDARVHLAWHEALEALSAVGLRAGRAETVDELLQRLRQPPPDPPAVGGAGPKGSRGRNTTRPGPAPKGRAIAPGTAAHQALARLGDTVVQTAYAGRDATLALAERAEADRATVVAGCRAGLDRRTRLRADLDPRPGLARIRAERATARAAAASPT